MQCNEAPNNKCRGYVPYFGWFPEPGRGYVSFLGSFPFSKTHQTATFVIYRAFACHPQPPTKTVPPEFCFFFFGFLEAGMENHKNTMRGPLRAEPNTVRNPASLGTFHFLARKRISSSRRGPYISEPGISCPVIALSSQDSQSQFPFHFPFSFPFDSPLY